MKRPNEQPCTEGSPTPSYLDLYDDAALPPAHDGILGRDWDGSSDVGESDTESTSSFELASPYDPPLDRVSSRLNVLRHNAQAGVPLSSEASAAIVDNMLNELFDRTTARDSAVRNDAISMAVERGIIQLDALVELERDRDALRREDEAERERASGAERVPDSDEAGRGLSDNEELRERLAELLRENLSLRDRNAILVNEVRHLTDIVREMRRSGPAQSAHPDARAERDVAPVRDHTGTPGR